jgi:hypothetical protein
MTLAKQGKSVFDFAEVKNKDLLNILKKIHP